MGLRSTPITCAVSALSWPARKDGPAWTSPLDPGARRLQGRQFSSFNYSVARTGVQLGGVEDGEITKVDGPDARPTAHIQHATRVVVRRAVELVIKRQEGYGMLQI